MTDSDFEKYYQKGGTYILPIEVFNELFGEMENWKKECKQKENIIKEVREYIEEQLCQGGERETRDLVDGNNILEILDKGE